MIVPPEAGRSAGAAADMPIPEMNPPAEPGGPRSRSTTGTEIAATGDMPIREMNAEPQASGIQPRPMSGAGTVGAGEMPIRDMNAEAQQPTGAQVETAHEREKRLAYLRDRGDNHPSKGSAGPGEMPTRDMNASG